MDDLRPLEGEESLLEAALLTAFSPPPSHRQSVPPQARSTSISQPPASDSSTEENSISSGPTDDLWKTEYESQVQSWRAQSAEARERAEKERERWEAIRAAEKEDANLRNTEGIIDESRVSTHAHAEAGWETVGKKKSYEQTPEQTVVSMSPSSSPADSRDLVAGESEKKPVPPITNAGPPTIPRASHSRQDTGDESQKWEDVQSSLTSSFPSMSFPERTETPSPSQSHPLSPPAPISATLAIFDSSLSTRTRVTALFSSLAINMLLPFVNGVMLGFGEIFAKNVVLEWFGWKTPSARRVATTTGIGVRLPSQQQQI